MIDEPFWRPSDCSGFIFDWDGVIAETRLDFSGIRNKYFDGKRVSILKEMKKLPEEVKVELASELVELEMSGASSASLIPGALDLVHTLNDRHIPWSVVSRNCRDSVELAASVIGFDLPGDTFTRESGHVKPSPEALWMASSSMGVSPRDCVVIGDFIYDLVGARRAGMRAILVNNNNPEWASFADMAFDRLSHFLKLFKSDRRIMAWEYGDLVAERGDNWLVKAWDTGISITNVIPGDMSLCLKLASLGVGRFYVDSDLELTPDFFHYDQILSLGDIACPVGEVLKRLLENRFPLVSVETGEKGVPLLKFRGNCSKTLEEVVKL